MKGLVLDAEALTLLDEKPSVSRKRLLALLEQAVLAGLEICVPSTTFAQAYFDGRKQAELMRFIQRAYVKREPLDFPAARVIGKERHRTHHLDIVDQHVAALARSRDLTVVTSDSDYDKALGIGSIVRV